MTTEELVQGSAEWYAIRLGKVTASRIADLTARTKTGWGASRANYLAELLIERLTKEPAPSFMSDAMKWGIEHEAEARAAYEWRTDCEVVDVGFVTHPSIAMAGASPDGLVGTEGLVEIKCPNTATHLETLLSETVPDKYMKQMQFQMACTERQWCDWASYDPRVPENMRLFVKRVPRDRALIGEIDAQVIEFLAEVDKRLAQLLIKYHAPEPTILAAG